MNSLNLKSTINKKVISSLLFCFGLLLLAACESPKIEDSLPVRGGTENPATLERDFTIVNSSIVTGTFKNLYAPSGGSSTTGAPGPATLPFVKFSFSKGSIVSQGSNDWDIAFQATTIIVNGGAKFKVTDHLEPDRTGKGGLYLEMKAFDEVAAADGARIVKDAAGKYALPTESENGWYEYVFADHVVLPIKGRTIVVRTRDGKYAKMEILSYYKNAPNPVPSQSLDFGYYTFRYAYQTNGTTSLK